MAPASPPDRPGTPEPFAGLGLQTLDLRLTDDAVAVLRIDRPDRMNSQTVRMFTEFGLAADAIRDSPARAVVLAGAGSRAFCAGFDLAEIGVLADWGVRDFLAFQETATNGIQAIRYLPVPVIAAVHGGAVGGGLALALAADIRLVAPSAIFSAAFVNIGLSLGELGTSYHLSRLVGPGVAAEIGFTGRRVGAEEAVRIGLANALVPEDELLDAALGMARAIAAQPTEAVRIAKRTIQRSTELTSYDAALEYGARGWALLADAGARGGSGG